MLDFVIPARAGIYTLAIDYSLDYRVKPDNDKMKRPWKFTFIIEKMLIFRHN
jgi:hypothetical protein